MASDVPSTRLPGTSGGAAVQTVSMGRRAGFDRTRSRLVGWRGAPLAWLGRARCASGSLSAARGSLGRPLWSRRRLFDVPGPASLWGRPAGAGLFRVWFGCSGASRGALRFAAARSERRGCPFPLRCSPENRTFLRGLRTSAGSIRTEPRLVPCSSDVLGGRLHPRPLARRLLARGLSPSRAWSGGWELEAVLRGRRRVDPGVFGGSPADSTVGRGVVRSVRSGQAGFLSRRADQGRSAQRAAGRCAAPSVVPRRPLPSDCVDLMHVAAYSVRGGVAGQSVRLNAHQRQRARKIKRSIAGTRTRDLQVPRSPL